METYTRALASVRRVDAIDPIPGADAIDVATIEGWDVVVKKGEFEVGQQVVYFEIDSWVPHEVAPFLSKGQEPKVYEGVQGARLRTMRMRGQLSQGLILPTTVIPPSDVKYEDGADVTTALGVLKWEAQERGMGGGASIGGNPRGSFPSAVPKTDQPRIQNLSRRIESLREGTYEVTEKLHGTSCTYYLDFDGDFHVCSRNLDLREMEGNVLWELANRHNVKDAMTSAGLIGYAVQGEVTGTGICGNQYKEEHTFRAYDIYDVKRGDYMSPVDRMKKLIEMGLTSVPVIEAAFTIPADWGMKELVMSADGRSVVNGSRREGLVYKRNSDTRTSFKVVSNDWLLKTGE